MAAKFNLSADSTTTRLNAEQAYRQANEGVFAANRDDLASGWLTFKDVAQMEVRFYAADLAAAGIDTDEFDAYVDDEERAVELLRAQLVEAAKNDDSFLNDWARSHPDAVAVAASVKAGRTGEEGESLDTLCVFTFEGDVIFLEISDDADHSYTHETIEKAMEAMESRIKDLVYYATHSSTDEGEDFEDETKWVEVSR